MPSLLPALMCDNARQAYGEKALARAQTACCAVFYIVDNTGGGGKDSLCQGRVQRSTAAKQTMHRNFSARCFLPEKALARPACLDENMA